MKHVFVNKMVAPITGIPDQNNERIDEVLYGMKLEVLEDVNDTWLRIRTHYAYEGYIEKKYVIENKYKQERWTQSVIKVVLNSFADVLAQPNVRSKILVTVSRGGILEQIEPMDINGYVLVNLCDGRVGYINHNFLLHYESMNIYQKYYRNEDQLRKELVYTALKYLGTQYRWGGKSPLGIDCSGLCQMAYMINGILIFRDSRIEPGFPVVDIPKKNMGPGDLLYFPGHVAMYIGDDEYVHATAKEGSDGVVVNSLNPKAINYRKDLADSWYAVGSIFKS